MKALSHYFELRVLGNPELTLSEILSHLMQQIHFALPAYQGRVGIDFPKYGEKGSLGSIIRLFGNEEHIGSLHASMSQNPQILSYAQISPVKDTPTQGGGRRLTRQNIKSPAQLQRLKKRHEARGTWTEALENGITAKYSTPHLRPHVRLQSSSRGGSFPLAINCSLVQAPTEGLFSSYGLSLGEAAVPVFS